MAVPPTVRLAGLRTVTVLALVLLLSLALVARREGGEVGGRSLRAEATPTAGNATAAGEPVRSKL
jgi:uncharacterized membrane protein